MEVSALTRGRIDSSENSAGNNGLMSLYSGVSGVGKSSLIRAIDPLGPKIRKYHWLTYGGDTLPLSTRCPLGGGGLSLTLRVSAASDWWTSNLMS